MNMLPSLWPGEVASYDAVRRTCRVRIPGITDGSDTLPEAVFINALGDRASDTEIRILAGDLVWLMFEGGDPRFPIIAGYRTPREGNPTQWRRWRHANIQLIAENTMLLTVGATNVTITDGSVAITGANLSVSGNITSGGNITAAGNVADQGGAKTMSGMRGTFNGHTHAENGVTTATPNQSM